jgi:hypothetical protein
LIPLVTEDGLKIGIDSKRYTITAAFPEIAVERGR